MDIGKRGDVIYYTGVFKDVLGVHTNLEHHAIDCGDGTVIEFGGGTRESKFLADIWRSSKEEFVNRAHEGRIYTKDYPNRDDVDVIMKRAFTALKEGFGKYDLIHNNCQHFTSWCVTGVGESKQSEAVLEIFDNLSTHGYIPEFIQAIRWSHSFWHALTNH
ncbi:MAG: hypothetical protein ACI9S8_003101 [Chlamydiales bacterium]|jgi:hypothetical protein